MSTSTTWPPACAPTPSRRSSPTCGSTSCSPNATSVTYKDPMGWRLEDVVERQRRSPRHYPIPPSAEREGLQAGDLVKLVFLDGDDAERMWVEIDSVDGDQLVGTLANQPNVIDLQAGAEVRFQPRHVAAIVFEPIDDS